MRVDRSRIAAVFLLSLAACSDESAATEPVVPRIYTASYPTAYLTERIVGDLIEVVCPVPEDADAASWQPPREVLALYQRAQLIVFNGAGFEQWRDRASLPLSRVVDTAQGFQDEWIVRDAGPVHSHGTGGAHSHRGPDGHTWMDPVLAKKQAKAILDAVTGGLTSLDGKRLQENFKALAKDLDGLDAKLGALAPKLGEVQLFCAHAAYDYIAKRHGFAVVDLDIDPGHGLTDEHRKKLDGLSGGKHRVLLWESDPPPALVEELQKRWQVASVVYSPCEVLPETQRASGDDWLSLMQANVERLSRAIVDR